MKVVFAALLACVLMIGCTGTYSTVEKDDRVYAMSGQQAWKIVQTSVRSSVSPWQIRDEASRAMSSAARTQFLFVSSNAHAVAVRLNGVDEKGRTKEGYGFIVTYWGNIPFPQTPARIYRLMEEQAQKSGEPLTVSREEQRKSRLDINYLRLLRP